MCTLFLIRHGQTDWNLQRRLQGSRDIPLNEKGRSQAQALCKQFSEISLAAIYTSNLSRAYETALILKGTRPLPLETFHTLQERSFGELEGKLTEELDKDPSPFENLPLEEKLPAKAASLQESDHEVIERVIPTLKMLAERHIGENIVIVTHGGVMRILMLVFESKDSFIENGQVVKCLYENKRFTFK